MMHIVPSYRPSFTKSLTIMYAFIRTCDRNQNRDSGNMKLTFGKRTILLEEGDISKKHVSINITRQA